MGKPLELWCRRTGPLATSLLSPKTNARRWAFFAVLLVGLAVVFPFRNFAGDDAYISFRFARNLAEGAGFSFNPSQPTYGSTSPLWVFMLAVLYRAGLPMLLASHILTYSFVALSLLMMWRLGEIYLRGLTFVALATLLLAVDPWFIKWGMSGMENSLALFLLLTGWYFQLRLRDSGRVNALSPVAWSLGALVRPEMFLILGLGLVDNLLHEHQRRWANAGAAPLILAAVYGPWLLYANDQFGTIIPNTIRAKNNTAAYGETVTATVKWLGSFWALGLASSAAFSLRYRNRLWAYVSNASPRSRYFLPIAWMLGLPLFYILGRAPISARYEMYATPAFVLVGVKALELLSERWQPRIRLATVLAFGAVSLVYLGGVTLTFNWYNTGYSQGLDPRLIGLSRGLGDASEPGDWVAADQIGAIGYYSGLNVLDIIGLVSPEMIPVREEARAGSDNTVWDYVYSRRPRFLFLTDGPDLLKEHGPAYRICESASAGRCVRQIHVSPVRREGALGSEEQLYYIYRTAW